MSVGSSCLALYPVWSFLLFFFWDSCTLNTLLVSCAWKLKFYVINQGAPLCTHYAQRGACKFGSACKFDHPVGTLSYSPSASSLTDVPVAPYPVGSSIGTLAPSSSSSELRPELNSGTSKDSASTRMSSSPSTVSGSVGSTVSKDGVAHLGDQQSAQGSGPSTTSDNSTESHSSS